MVMAVACSCLVESDLLRAKHMCTIEAPTLEEFLAKLVCDLQIIKIPLHQLSFEVYNDEFEDFVGEYS